jgi:hypothetical protein
MPKAIAIVLIGASMLVAGAASFRARGIHQPTAMQAPGPVAFVTPSNDCRSSLQCSAGFRWAIDNEINEYRLCNVSGAFGKGCRELVSLHLELQGAESMFSLY